jgi:hypothetical protein
MEIVAYYAVADAAIAEAQTGKLTQPMSLS